MVGTRFHPKKENKFSTIVANYSILANGRIYLAFHTNDEQKPKRELLPNSCKALPIYRRWDNQDKDHGFRHNSIAVAVVHVDVQ